MRASGRVACEFIAAQQSFFSFSDIDALPRWLTIWRWNLEFLYYTRIVGATEKSHDQLSVSQNARVASMVNYQSAHSNKMCTRRRIKCARLLNLSTIGLPSILSN